MDAGIAIEIADPKIDAKWGTVLFKLGEIACHGLMAFTGAPDSVGNTLNAIHNLFEGVQINDTDGTKAWRLIVMSIANAVSDLGATSLDDTQQKAVIDAFKIYRKNINAILKSREHILSPRFFTYPANLDIYQALRKELSIALKSARLDRNVDIQNLCGKLDKAFNSSVYRILAAEPEYFQSLRTALETKGLKTAQHEYDWASYRAQLIEQFEVAPIFGQEESKISLSQLYIPPRAQWWETKTDEDGFKIRMQHTVWLESEIMDWIKKCSTNRAIKLIHGGPGRGKSTFAKALSAKLAENEGVRPLFIELQKLHLGGKLIDELSDLLTRKIKAFETSPLSTAYEDLNRPFIVVFDGLDELARPGGKGADDLARDFSYAVRDFLDTFNSSNKVNVLAIVTGRDTIIQALKERSQGMEDRDVLEACGYAPIDDAVTKIGKIDQRPIWWKYYATAKGKPTTAPKAFVAEELSDLSNEPLLCYLMALAEIIGHNWKKIVDNRNIIYEQLLHDVWDRKWGNGRAGPTESITSEDDFKLLMETMALAAWHGDETQNRIATISGFDKACLITRAGGVWKKFSEDHAQNTEKSLSSLALTFYFKRPGTDMNGLEFSHKSFSEYLTARLIFRSSMEMTEDFNLPRSNPDALLRNWLELTGPTCIDEFIFPFIRNEARTIKTPQLKTTRKTLEAIFNIIIQDGMPAHELAPLSWRHAERMQRNGEIALLACLNAVVRELFKRDSNTEIINFNWNGDRLNQARFIRRLSDNEGSIVFCFLGLSHINFHTRSGSFMTGLFLANAQLENCNLSQSVLAHGYLSSATLTNADLSSATLSNSDLSGAQLMGANLRHADLIEANLTDADLTGAVLSQAELFGANFSGTVIRNAKLPVDWAKHVYFDKDTPPIGKPKLAR